MRLLVITSTSLRHWALVATLAREHDVTALIQVPGAAPVTGPAQAAYYQRMAAAERELFGLLPMVEEVNVLVRPLARQVAPVAVIADRAIVFGGGLIAGELLQQCRDLDAINLHAGLAPEYRGTACNFWAAYDGHPELVGCTLHRLTDRVDAGPIHRRIHAANGVTDPWRRSMQAVAMAIAAIPTLLAHPTEPQPAFDRRPIRYSRAADWTEPVAADFLNRYAPDPLASYYQSLP